MTGLVTQCQRLGAAQQELPSAVSWLCNSTSLLTSWNVSAVTQAEDTKETEDHVHLISALCPTNQKMFPPGSVKERSPFQTNEWLT